MTQPPRPRWSGRRWGVWGVLIALMVAGLASVGSASAVAEQTTSSRGVDRACPSSVQHLDLFPDVEPGTHFEAINCVRYYEVTHGREAPDAPDGRVYAPAASVTRGQMASFIARTIEFIVQEELPASVRFGDDAVVHQSSIRKLATAGVVQGLDDDIYAPGLDVTRAQMASFITGAIEFVLEEELVAEATFPDIDGPHQTSIEKLGAIGVVTGRADGTYAPQQAVTRAQMASFIARGMDLLAERGAFPDVVDPIGGTPSTEPNHGPGEPGPMGVADVRLGSHGGFDRVVFDVEGAGAVGWQVGYVDEARDRETGELIEVAGNRILRVMLIGVASPADLPDGIDLWAGSRRDGTEDGLVVEVVDEGVLDGAHTFYIGTVGQLPFVVERAADPQRLVIDIFRGFQALVPPDIEHPLPDPDVVASFTTSLVPGQPRNVNIGLAASLIDGDVIPAGTTYSLDSAIGPRTSARGFIQNGFIDSDGELISVVGGGVSQLATTFLNAAWFSGIELVEFRPHTIYFQRYPMCREATLIRNQLDVLVRNDSPYDITVSTAWSEEAVTVDLVSISWAEVDSWIGSPSDVEGIGMGFSVTCGRTVTYPDGTSSSEDYFWRYNEGFPG